MADKGACPGYIAGHPCWGPPRCLVQFCGVDSPLKKKVTRCHRTFHFLVGKPVMVTVEFKIISIGEIVEAKMVCLQALSPSLLGRRSELVTQRLLRGGAIVA